MLGIISILCNNFLITTSPYVIISPLLYDAKILKFNFIEILKYNGAYLQLPCESKKEVTDILLQVQRISFLLKYIANIRHFPLFGKYNKSG